MDNHDNLKLIQQTTSRVVEPWRQALPTFPWNAVEQLTTAIIFKHPQILLVTIDQAKKIISEEGIDYPPQFSVGDIAGRTNPALVKTRSALK
ncbi:hypothetical protein A2767_02010 [Candidatus Roizmanbacteria bacterium RIFCSPHIGHO2_01_FULL_35_10]|uniref:Uncharacterized protein n=1 Tax=Candidatus Roizmanbacteria bacterium RIFCSPLOWO2_01_FULL_35_13 TaxID=1802055 RepID=A0A1F7I792_9BACT|nr:MAG: hypothetical protein A2767_02010 [Candidatus Roizmanbacteria bacterium RIFCSPHIGHO2_01_FULL_35_10]OGK39235.1 MAG: hypothetical protein A3A74_07425 [Candidatus Roizmanbacteria bacterium RIFCSPLOWO2_01_FULL_35_13]